MSRGLGDVYKRQQVTREDVQKLLDNGVPKAQAAKELGIGRATLYRLLADSDV